ncbi:hypothetical protein Ocin01_09668 [Orchesella cincta]|uniref:PHD-type domain-containing protein n=1 Tax=Orchesella cincta TaxID=48709 RepID=A0A1D2MVB7_ORCCI|nr:hypothetical protein Ocin01_09668 [Orchesella cincta]
MSPPPPPHHSQQQGSVLCASPPPPVSQHQQQHHIIPGPQLGYNVNGGGGMGDIVCSSKNSSNYSDKHNKVSDEAVSEMLRITSEEIRDKERDMLSIFPNLSSAMHSTNDIDNVNMTVESDRSSEVTSSTGCGLDDRTNSNSNASNASTTLPIMSGEDTSASTTHPRELINNGNKTPDISNSSTTGCGAMVNQTPSGNTNGGNNRASCSPQMKPMGSPTNPGNGHQMMPVRLQNMQKGARTKASMKKLMQEQQITTPNGQAPDTNSDTSQFSAKDSDSVEALTEPAPKMESKSKAKGSPKRKKSAAASTPIIDPYVPQSSVIVSDLTTGAVSAIAVARPGYTKSGKKIGRPRKDASTANTPSTPKGKKGSKSPKKTKASLKAQFSEPLPPMMQVPESELATALSETVASLAETVIPIVEEPNNAVVVKVDKAKSPKAKVGKANPRKRSSKALNDTGDDEEEQLIQVATVVDLNIPPLIIKQSQTTPVPEELAPTPLGGKRRKQSKSIPNVEQPEDVNLTLNAPQSSEISEQEAESVATRVAQSLPSPPKGKGKRRKSTSALKESKKRKGAKQRAAVTLPKVIPKETDTSPERRDLPRLRSRSPKQGESPPLRISSPRAAKERSLTPASTTSQATTQRPRASKEKDVSRGVVTTPLSSPTLRSPKKESTTTARGKAKGRNKGKKISVEESVELQDDDLMLSPPPAKRLRQMSKESSESEVQGRRRSSVVETRLSVDSEKSRPLTGKRSSRRKSGSVSGSIDNPLVSPTPSFNQSNSSINAPSETSLEVTAHSSSLDSSLEVQSDIVVTPTQEEDTTTLSSPIEVISPRRKGKRAAAKSRSKLRKSRPSTEIVEGTIFTEDEPVVEDIPVIPSQDDVPIVSPDAPAPTAKSTKKQRKTAAKKGKKVAILLSAESEPVQGPPLDIPEPPLETVAVVEVQVPVAPKQKGRKGKASNKTSKTVVPIIPPPVLNIPEFTPPKKEVKTKQTGKASKQGKKLSKEKESISSPPQPSFSLPQDLSPSRRRRPSVLSPNTQTSAKSSTSSGPDSPTKVKSETTAGAGVPASPSKQSRRDSRSVSHDYCDVSVVLTDIAQSLSSGDFPYSNISNTLSRQSLQSPTSNSLPMSPPIPTEPPVSPLKMEGWDGKTEHDVKGKVVPKKKRQSKPKSLTNASEEPPLKINKVKAQNKNNELLERKATLEAEVAQVLLEMKSGNSSSSSKSPSPAKSIPIVEANEGSTIIITPSKKQTTKQRKRKNSTSPRRASFKQEAVAEEELDSSLSPVAATPMPVISLNHARKKKLAKEKPVSKIKAKAKKALAAAAAAAAAASSSTFPVLSSTPIVGSTANVDQDGFIGNSIALTPVTTVKVSKTASIPAASGFEMGASLTTPVYAVKSKPELKPKLGRKRKERTKIENSSPDITAFSSSKSISASASTTPAAPTLPVYKVRRPKKGAVKSEENVEGTEKKPKVKKSRSSSLTTATGLEADVSGVSSSPEAPVKKKRQRKIKGESVAAVASSSMASTTNGGEDDASASTSKLFPYQIKPKPMKKPTVLAKRTPFVEDKVRKYEDNQKKKVIDSPMLKVVGGLTKFYRGGEEEEVDQDPKLPKEKAPTQTDNAVPWLCSFCHMGPHAQKLGDLFGPYFANLPSIYGEPSMKRETWIHGDCALWAGRLLLVDTYLRRLEETLLDADKETCTVCGKTGATVGCLRRHCKEAVHYPCAIRKFWKMDSANFHSYCPQHVP